MKRKIVLIFSLQTKDSRGKALFLENGFSPDPFLLNHKIKESISLKFVPTATNRGLF